jgi:hypothetical protein
MDITRTPPCRLDLVFAAEAPIAAVLRRGPSRRVHLVVWHTKTDQFVPGEWWHGRVYSERCGLSPNGQLLVYFAYQWRPRYIPEGIFAFTAVSRPPHFKPVTLWPADSTWGGGGYFADNRTLCLSYGESSAPTAHPDYPPKGFQVKTGQVPRRPNFLPPAGSAVYPDSDWSGKDHQGKNIFTRAGRLYRVVNRKEILLRDFNRDLPPPIQ